MKSMSNNAAHHMSPRRRMRRGLAIRTGDERLAEQRESQTDACARLTGQVVMAEVTGRRTNAPEPAQGRDFSFTATPPQADSSQQFGFSPVPVADR